MYFIECIEKALGKAARKRLLPLQPGDVPKTFANVDDLREAVDFKPATPIEEGIQKFVVWYREYYKIWDCSASGRETFSFLSAAAKSSPSV